MSATPITVAATLRGKDDVLKVRDLLDRLAEVESDMAAAEEYLDVLRRRRDDVLRLLENKGIRVAPDPIEIATANGEPA